MDKAERDYSIAAAEKLMKVVEFLCQGDFMEWKSIRKVAVGSGLSDNEAFRILKTLVKGKWVHQDPELGFRVDPEGKLLPILVHMQQQIIGLARKFGVKAKIQEG